MPKATTATEENPRRRRRRRRRNPDETHLRVVTPETRESNPSSDPEENPRRRRRRKKSRSRRRNPRRKNMKGSTVALIAVGALVGVPLLVMGGMALMGRSLFNKAKETGGVVVIPAQSVY